MRVLSRIFCVFVVAVVVATFSFAAKAGAVDALECTLNGFYWTGERCCWLYYRDSKGELTCIDEDSWGSYANLKNCDPQAGYIDITGEPHCCPEGLGDDKTHRCVCPEGKYFNNLTGNCDDHPSLILSPICDGWNPKGRPGYFFNYLLGKLKGINSYRSTHTCEEVINKIDNGSDILEWNALTCQCKCKDPALTFNPGAADECAESGQNCENICVDLIDQNVSCPNGQHAYYINNSWTCCRFYDPESGTCITTDAQWLQYVRNNESIFRSGGGYIGPDGLPIDCPEDEIEEGNGTTIVGVNPATGKCTCSWQHRNGGSVFPGFFDTTTGTCVQQYQLDVNYGVEAPSNIPTTGTYFLWTGSSGEYWKSRAITSTDTTSYVGTEMASASGFLDHWLHTVFNTNGNYTYTTLPVPSVANTQYIATDNEICCGHIVNAKRMFTVSFYGNNGTPTTQTKHFRLPSGWGDVHGSVITPSRPGYTFIDWYNTSNATGGSNVNSTLHNLTANASYYARWSANTITLNWDENGGSAITNGSCTYDGNLVLPAANATTKSGYQLDGWLVNGVLRTAGATISGGCTYSNVGVYSGTSNNIIRAQWSSTAPANVTITLDNNGATGGSCTTSVSCTPGSTCNLPQWSSSNCNISKGSKIFVGWTTTVPANHTSATTGTTGSISSPASNTTYYAVWKDTTCDITNGSGSATTSLNNAPQCTVTCDTGYQTSGTYTGTAGNPAFSYTCGRICYKFAVDNTTNGGNNSNGATTEFWMYLNTSTYNSKNCNIYPSLNDCSNGTNVMSGIVLPNNPANASWAGQYSTGGLNASYPFDEGWFFSDGSQNIAAGYSHCSSLSNTQGYYNSLVSAFGFQANNTPSITLRTLYECNSGYHYDNGACVGDGYTVTLNKNADDATAGTASVTATYNAAMPTSGVTMPTRANYTFAGYYDTSAATGGTKYYDENGASAHVWDKNESATLYARWTAKTYTITLNANGPSLNDRIFYEVYNTKWKNTSDATITTIPSWSWAGHVLQGYYTAATGGTLIIPASHVLPATTVIDDTNAPNGTITLYAQWGSECGPGTYMVNDECVDCPPGQSCAGGSAQPVDCTGNTYATGGASSCSNCPTGYVVAGTGTTYHDETCDCGRILHVGTYSLHLRSCKKTTPSLNFDFDKDGTADLFGNMTTTATNMSSANTKKFKMNYDGSTYYVCDDTSCN